MTFILGKPAALRNFEVKAQSTLKVHYGLHDFSTLECAVATTGTFDGVHLGHQKILRQLVQKAAKVGGESVLFTFDPHPRKVLQPDIELSLLNSIDEKIRLLEKTGLDHLIIQPFTKEFSRTPSLEFVREIMVGQIGVKHLVIGYDHHFGRNREGSFEHLMEFGPIYGFDVEEIKALDIDTVNVSSTKIRKALSTGQVDLALEYLGHPYALNGEVVEGDKIGRTIGFPTANIKLHFADKLIPADGVYAGWAVHRGTRYPAMANIGRRPTVGSIKRSIEVHLLEQDLALYGEQLTFELHQKIRDIVHFESLEALTEQLHRDKASTQTLLAQ